VLYHCCWIPTYLKVCYSY